MLGCYMSRIQEKVFSSVRPYSWRNTSLLPPLKKTHAFIAGQGHLFKTAGFKKIETTKEVWILRQSTHWDNLRIFLIKTPPPLYLFTFRSDDPDNLTVICFFFSETPLAGDINLIQGQRKEFQEQNISREIFNLRFILLTCIRVWWTKKAPTQFREVVKKTYFFGQPDQMGWPPAPH